MAAQTWLRGILVAEKKFSAEKSLWQKKIHEARLSVLGLYPVGTSRGCRLAEAVWLVESTEP